MPETKEYIKQRPDLNYIPTKMLEEKWDYKENYEKNMAPLESREKYVQIRKAMVHELWKAGVPLMAGSDSPEFFIVAGFALHEELATMIEAGLSPYAALQTATANPATFLGINKKTGSIEEGKEADLILLDKNPLEDIKNTQSINGVFVNGKWFDKTMLDNLLTAAKEIGN
jgi:imidazolonepropionase-like amidohydrolase